MKIALLFCPKCRVAFKADQIPVLGKFTDGKLAYVILSCEAGHFLGFGEE